MQEALSILGYPNPYHYASVFGNVKDADMWMEALNAKFKHQNNVDWKRHFNKLLGHCGAVTDVPCVLFWQELLEAYPDAKVVLVEREQAQWGRSFKDLIEGALNPIATYVLRYTDPQWLGRINVLAATWIEAFLGTTNLSKAQNAMIPAYREHYANIRATIPKDRMLEYQLGSGWEPLCKFLGKDVPNVPFPKRNEAKILQNGFGALIGKAIKHSLFNIFVVLVVTGSCGFVAKQYFR